MDLPELLIRGRRFVWGARTYVMGVINVTPDSFSDGGRHLTPGAARRQAECLVDAGADILDVGGESTRPFAKPVRPEDELRRVIPVIEEIRGFTEVPISIDTTKAAVAQAALEHGADLVNDVSALSFDPGMAGVIARFGCPVVLMHMKGSPGTMQIDPRYDDVFREVREFLADRVLQAAEAGIPRRSILVDPGIGFGKRFEDNLVLLNRLDGFAEIGCAVCVGPSRKAFLGTITGREKPMDRDVATLGAVAVAALRGAHLVRVHEAAWTKELLQVVDAIRREGISPEEAVPRRSTGLADRSGPTAGTGGEPPAF